MFMMKNVLLFLILCVMGLSLNACLILDATTDTTVNITDAVTHATTDILSSTSGGASTAANIRAKKLKKFAKHNSMNLQQDVAQGRGEYLSSLETLLEVPPQRHEEFTDFAQSNYELVFGTEDGMTDGALVQLAHFGSAEIREALSVQVAAK